MHLAEKTYSTKHSGDFSVRIHDLQPSVRYQNLFSVTWLLKGPCGHVLHQEFVLDYSEPIFTTFGIKCYRDTREHHVANSAHIAKILLDHLHVFEGGRDTQTTVMIVFSEDKRGDRIFCRPVYWSHLHSFQAEA
jgi:hypothetical protein